MVTVTGTKAPHLKANNGKQTPLVNGQPNRYQLEHKYPFLTIEFYFLVTTIDGPLPTGLLCLILFIYSFMFEYYKAAKNEVSLESELMLKGVVKQTKSSRTARYILEYLGHFSLMLFLMSLNGFLMTSVLLGLALGHFVFSSDA
ncbi:hypothetical protein HDV04_002273 [Boothiomyces sp. JEL0838]|nr:hypothetical protein HDV04_002273 [Boothiomyces sp. JEL0838]